ncbi:MAG: DUF362 domain-containing protein [Negativicutes bacterium]|nr:DUF362 domain-containing protein [Negativicutes bacterium]
MIWEKKNVAIRSTDNYRLQSVKKVLNEIFQDLGLSKENPLGGIVKPGNKVFIKPNWVASRWRESCLHKDYLYSVITHPSVIEAVTDEVAVALQGKGEIVIADNPSIDADFSELMDFTGIKKLENKYDISCKIYDLRPLVCNDLVNYGKKNKMVSRVGDPEGNVQINLGNESLFYNVDSNLFRGVFDEREDTIAAHTKDVQLYTYSSSLYNSDVYISVPKLKTHQKVGTTLNLKGLVGAITDKNQLVHWRVGYPEVGGDEYPTKSSYVTGQKAKVTHRGAWPGNDTIWRMVVDLYKGLLKRERKYFTVIDGIIAGEGQGPFCPTSKFANTLIACDDLLAGDIVATRLMGFDPQKISYLKYLIDDLQIRYSDIKVIKEGRTVTAFFEDKTRYLDFELPDAWEVIKMS